MKNLKMITLILMIAGGVNWGLIGFFNFNLVGAIFGGDASAVSRIIYCLVGLSTAYQIYIYPKGHKAVTSTTTEETTPSFKKAA